MLYDKPPLKAATLKRNPPLDLSRVHGPYKRLLKVASTTWQQDARPRIEE